MHCGARQGLTRGQVWQAGGSSLGQGSSAWGQVLVSGLGAGLGLKYSGAAVQDPGCLHDTSGMGGATRSRPSLTPLTDMRASGWAGAETMPAGVLWCQAGHAWWMNAAGPDRPHRCMVARSAHMPYLHVAHCVPYLHVVYCAPYLHVAHCVPYLHVAHCVPYLHVAHCAPYLHVAHCMPFLSSSRSCPPFPTCRLDWRLKKISDHLASKFGQGQARPLTVTFTAPRHPGAGPWGRSKLCKKVCMCVYTHTWGAVG